jgi:ferredoxin
MDCRQLPVALTPGGSTGSVGSVTLSGMKVSVDTSLCIGSGTCALTAPAVFDHDADQGLVVLLDPEPPPGEHEAVLAAVRHCPAAVIQAFS